MFATYLLHVLLLAINLATDTLATSRNDKGSIGEFQEHHMQSALTSRQSLEEGEIGYFSDGFAADLEEGEIRDDDEVACPYSSFDYEQSLHHQGQSSTAGLSRQEMQEQQARYTSESEVWNEIQGDDLEEGEIRDWSESEAWQEEDGEDFHLGTVSSDEDRLTIASHADSQREGSSGMCDSTTTAAEYEKKASLLYDILHRPALPLISARHQPKSPNHTVNRSRPPLSNTPARSDRARQSASHSSEDQGDIFSFDESLSIKDRRQRQRAVFERLWIEEGISYDWGPEGVALKVAELKIEYGHDSTIGPVASVKVQRETDEEYYHQYQLATRTYSRKICQERNNLKMEPKYHHLHEWEKKRLLTKLIAKYQPRHYLERRTKGNFSTQNDMRLDQTAKEVWNEFINIVRDRLEYPELQEEELSIEHIEEQARNLQLGGNDKKATVELLKRYMVRFMGMTRQEIRQFSINRLQYRYQVHTKKHNAEEKKRRQELRLVASKKSGKKKSSMSAA